MRSLFRYLLELCEQIESYTSLKEPYRILTYLSPFILLTLLSFFTNFNIDWLIIITLVLVFLPTLIKFFISKKYIYTYIVGCPIKFKHEVDIEYLGDQNRQQILEWLKDNSIKLYRGHFYPNYHAKFYFKHQDDALRFKLRW